jgi:hypothetical protein
MNSEESRTSSRRWVWLEEYEQCSCTNVTELRRDATGYCPRHFTDKKRITKLPNDGPNKLELGYVGMG